MDKLNAEVNSQIDILYKYHNKYQDEKAFEQLFLFTVVSLQIQYYYVECRQHTCRL